MQDNYQQPSDNEIKADLYLEITKYSIEYFGKAVSLFYNYEERYNLEFDVNILTADANRLFWSIRGREQYNLPVDEKEWIMLNEIRRRIDVKQNLLQKNQEERQNLYTNLGVGLMLALLFTAGMFIDNNSKK